MENITLEGAISKRDTIASPRYIINNILENEGMGSYVEMACSRILQLADEHQISDEDICLNFIDFNVQVTLFGFLFVKSILLSYISEEKYQEYLYALRVKNEQVQAWNGMINFLRGFSKKQLHKLQKEIKESKEEKDKERMLSLVQCELKARSFGSAIKNWYQKIKLKIYVNVKAYSIVDLMRKKTV